ncbi:hypothetical protein RRM51_000301 [Aeromonas veronii]|uniref:Cro/CI family transcriptional regulator n=1 Tax=Aeromonas veronii TaxID=654 RepID=UPI00226CC0CD|nr:Cro/CI family transcriptional regulator [Aeromonas veronii]ELI6420942.1 hypothetical protein [Aeromonas veronii]MCX9112649.1 Cro/CI family transcriptional regulator [Aeromonas veronii]
MKKEHALSFFGGNNAVARAIGVSKGTVSEWPEVIPEKFATRIYFASGEQIEFCLEDYRPPQN